MYQTIKILNNFFTRSLRICSSFYSILPDFFYIFQNFEFINSKIGEEFRSPPNPPPEPEHVTVTPSPPPCLLLLMKPPFSLTLSRRPHSTYRSLSLNLPHHRFPARSPATPTSGAAATAPTRTHGLTRRRLPKTGEPHRRRLADSGEPHRRRLSEPGEHHRRHDRALAVLPASAPRVGVARRRRARGLLPSLRALRGPALRLRRRGG
jgi:hypothetical protein